MMVRSNSVLMKIDKLFMVVLDENIVDRLADVRLAMTGTALADQAYQSTVLSCRNCRNYFQLFVDAVYGVK
jgi:hypothetical protein